MVFTPENELGGGGTVDLSKELHELSNGGWDFVHICPVGDVILPFIYALVVQAWLVVST